MLSLDNVDLDSIVVALQDQTDYEHHHLIDPRTGEMAFWTRDCGIDGRNPVDLDELELTVIWPLPSSVWYRDMADFAERVSDERAGRRLVRALRGKGAFRRFRDELHEEYPDLLASWHEFSEVRARRRAVEWLADQGLVDGPTAERYVEEHADPEPP